MGKLALLAFAVLLPTLVGGAILVGVRGYRRLSRLRQSWLRQTRPLPPEPVERVAARLRRLRAGLEEIENQPGGTAKRHHLLALRGAYLDTLSSACQRFRVSPPAGGDQARQSEIYRVEAALREHGLDVREAAVR
jgi:pimeloyl-ACP methyl ester carboxylesterase